LKRGTGALRRIDGEYLCPLFSGGRLAAARVLASLGLGVKESRDGSIVRFRGDEAEPVLSLMQRPTGGSIRLATIYLRAAVGLAGLLLIMGLVLFLPTWTAHWWRGWAYWAIFFVCTLAATLYFLKVAPDLIERRLGAGPVAEPTVKQKVVQSFASLFFVAALIIPSVDHRFGWSRVPLVVSVVTDVIVVVAFWIVFEVFDENRFASAVVTSEAGQPVISTGPYRLVRHPMYSGGILLMVVTPLALGSWWGLMPGVLLGVVIVVRLLDEERLLRAELPGYLAYCEKVRRRLIPGIW
jgi:protein-S-isoprenylcysteine O-methyltransferase Ste14